MSSTKPTEESVMIGKLLMEYRMRKGLTRSDVVKGIGMGEINHIEAGKFHGMMKLLLIAKSLGVPGDELLGCVKKRNIVHEERKPGPKGTLSKVQAMEEKIAALEKAIESMKSKGQTVQNSGYPPTEYRRHQF